MNEYSNLKDLSTMRFGRLVIIKQVGMDKHRNSLWECKCDCGTIKVIGRGSLISGNTQSCGCKHKEHLIRHLLPPGEGAMRHLYKRYKGSARVRKLEWDLSYDDFRWLTSQNCRYCNAPPSKKIPGDFRKNGKKSKYNGDYIFNGIDRVDNSRGYTFTNCWTCCYKCNVAKHNHSITDFIKHAKAIADTWSIK